MNAKNRIPWIVAAAAMLFAMIVLVRNEITPDRPVYNPATNSQLSMQQPASQDWRPSNASIPTPALPTTTDRSPWKDSAAAATPVVPPVSATPVATQTPAPTPTAAPIIKNSFRGVILNDAGKPVPSAMVRIVSGGDSNSSERSAVSDEQGHFEIADIPHEKLDKVIVEARGHSTTLMENIPLPLNQDMQIGLSPLAGIDALVLDFSTTNSEPVMFSGRMQASLLRLSRADEVDTSTLGISQPVLPVDSYLPVSDQNVVVVEGLLQFDNVEPGRYRVAVKSGVKVAESEIMDVREDSRTSTTLTLGTKHTVKGKVVAEDTAGAVSQARVTLTPSRQPSSAPEFPEYLSFTDGDGEFVIPEVQPGSYWMVVGALGYTTKTLENYIVQPATSPEDTSVTLIKQEPLITVNVVNNEGRPVNQARLVLMSVGGPTPRIYYGSTDEAGLYRFENLLPGRFNLTVTAPGDRGRQKTIPVDLGEGEVKEFPIHFGVSVVVSGKATRNGKAYKGAISFVMRGAAMADKVITAGNDGEYKVDLETGEYMVGTPEKPASELIKIDGSEQQTINLDFK